MARSGRRGAPRMTRHMPRPTDGYRFWVVAHTHWDREWPLPYRDTQLRLGDTLREILDVLERDPRFTSFTFDGQTAAIEDHLELHPSDAERVRRAIADRRLLVGPSYVVPDEFLASGEALVRNLLLGRRSAEALGVPVMAVGYLADSFGHVAQLPQILRGFGLDAFVFWRGLGDEAEELGSSFVWVAPDGSEVLAVRQVGGYGSAAELGRWGSLDSFGNLGDPLHDQPDRWDAAASAWMDRFMELFGGEYATSGLHDVLLCNGYDHTRIQADLPDILAVVASEHPGARFAISSYPEYVAIVRAELRDPPRHEGELCGGRYASVFRSVNSTRGWLKRANELADRSLLVAELVASLAELQRWEAGGAWGRWHDRAALTGRPAAGMARAHPEPVPRLHQRQLGRRGRRGHGHPLRDHDADREARHAGGAGAAGPPGCALELRGADRGDRVGAQRPAVPAPCPGDPPPAGRATAGPVHHGDHRRGRGARAAHDRRRRAARRRGPGRTRPDGPDRPSGRRRPRLGILVRRGAPGAMLPTASRTRRTACA